LAYSLIGSSVLRRTRIHSQSLVSRGRIIYRNNRHHVGRRSPSGGLALLFAQLRKLIFAIGFAQHRFERTGGR